MEPASMAAAAALAAKAGGSAAGAGGAGAGAGAFGASQILQLISGGLQGAGAMGGAAGTKRGAKEQRRRTIAELYAALLSQQQNEFQNRRQIENQRSAQQGNALQELASGFRASLTGR